jgi:hypothetical protein
VERSKPGAEGRAAGTADRRRGGRPGPDEKPLAPLSAAIEKEVARASSPALALARLLAEQDPAAAEDRDERQRALDDASAADESRAKEELGLAPEAEGGSERAEGEEEELPVRWLVIGSDADSLRDWLDEHSGHAREGDLIVVDVAPEALADLRERLATRSIQVRDGSAADFVPPESHENPAERELAHDADAGEPAEAGAGAGEGATRTLGYLGTDDGESRAVRVVIRLDRRGE